MKNPYIKGNWHSGEKEINLMLPLIEFEENKTTVVYCPALDLAGYGIDEREAYKSFETVLSEFLDYSTTKKTLLTDLKRLGWSIGKKIMRPPQMSVLLDNSPEFKKVFNHKTYRQVPTKITMPALYV